jgi:hypothetical protein
MRNMKTRLVVFMQIFAVLVVAVVSGCATPTGHQSAFSDKTALVGNIRQLDFSKSQALRVSQQELIHRGFTLDNVDLNAGLIKATRNLQDTAVPEQSYLVTASVYAFENGPESCTVTLAASQQTILHREWKTWWHLLWLIPIFPTGTEYQTVVTREGNITDPGVYANFFTAITIAGENLKAAEKAAAQKAAAQKAAADKAAAEKAAVQSAAVDVTKAENTAAPTK